MACAIKFSVVAGVAGQDDDAAGKLDAIAIGRLDQIAVVDLEAADAKPIAIVDDAIAVELVRNDASAGFRQCLVRNADGDVGFERFGHVMHQVPGARRADDPHRARPSAERPAEPAGQPEVGNANHVVRVEVGQQQKIDAADRHAELKQPHGRAAPGVDQDRLRSRLDQGRRPKPRGVRPRVPLPSSVTLNRCVDTTASSLVRGKAGHFHCRRPPGNVVALNSGEGLRRVPVG